MNIVVGVMGFLILVSIGMNAYILVKRCWDDYSFKKSEHEFRTKLHHDLNQLTTVNNELNLKVDKLRDENLKIKLSNMELKENITTVISLLEKKGVIQPNDVPKNTIEIECLY